MEGKIYKIGNKCYKTGNNFFMYNPTESNAPIAGLFSPRDMEVGIIPDEDPDVSLRGKKGIFICNAGDDTVNPLNGSIVIRDFYNTNVTLKTINTDSYDSGNNPVGLALDLENDIFYVATNNKICKIKYSTNDVLGSYTSNSASFHDVFLDTTNDVLYTSNYSSSSGSLYIISTIPTLDPTPLLNLVRPIITIVGAIHSLIISADLATNRLFIASWGDGAGSHKIMSFKRTAVNTIDWVQTLQTYSFADFQPYGLNLIYNSLNNYTLYVSGHDYGNFNGFVKKFTITEPGGIITYNEISQYSSGGEGLAGNNPTGIILDTFATIPRLIVANSNTPPNPTYSGNSLNFIPLSLFP